jgi:tetratricopeptide (TPR) repeat protein
VKHKIYYLLLLFFAARLTAGQGFDTSTSFGLAQQASYEQEYLKALEFGKKALLENPEDSDAYYLLAQVYSALDSANSEKKILEAARSKFPDNEEIAYRLGRVKMNQAEYQSAVDDFLSVLNIIKDKEILTYLETASHLELGNAFLRLKRYEESIKYYSKVLEIQTENAAAFINRGMAYYNFKNKSAACKDWERGYHLGIYEAKKYIDKYCKK